ncbi:MAG: hypothetical protein IT378_05975 [Sandaracinaceae bacterium]|nr:hypothetical protein [Sandaracinaceae bacterium]
MLETRHDGVHAKHAPEKREIESPDKKRRKRIRCPHCAWEPDGKPHWVCERCFAQFDTFVTRARCPSCPNSWRDTWCPRCDRPSPHEAWYADEPEA